MRSTLRIRPPDLPSTTMRWRSSGLASGRRHGMCAKTASAGAATRTTARWFPNASASHEPMPYGTSESCTGTTPPHAVRTPSTSPRSFGWARIGSRPSFVNVSDGTGAARPFTMAIAVGQSLGLGERRRAPRAHLQPDLPDVDAALFAREEAPLELRLRLVEAARLRQRNRQLVDERGGQRLLVRIRENGVGALSPPGGRPASAPGRGRCRCRHSPRRTSSPPGTRRWPSRRRPRRAACSPCCDGASEWRGSAPGPAPTTSSRPRPSRPRDTASRAGSARWRPSG